MNAAAITALMMHGLRDRKPGEEARIDPRLPQVKKKHVPSSRSMNRNHAMPCLFFKLMQTRP
jgi:hypothetical protein